jgi:integrase
MRTDAVILISNGAYWQARWRDAVGQRVSKSLGPKSQITRRQAVQLCRDLAAKHVVSPDSRGRPREITLEQWLTRYFELRADLAPTTSAMQQDTKNLLIKHFGADVRLDRISRAAAADFRRTLGKRSITETTIRKHIGIAKVMFAWAMRQDFIALNPFDREVTSILPVDRTWRYVTADELEQILDACPDDRWRSLFALARLAGLRLSEALALRPEHLDMKARTITVVPRRGVRTTKEARRTVPMQPRLHQVLTQRLASAGDAKLVCGLTHNNTRRDAIVIVKRAKLKPWPKLFHTLRKNLVTDWAAVYPPYDVAAWLGHDPKVAAGFYHQTKPETMAKVTRPAAATREDELLAEIARLKATIRGASR